MLTSIGKFSKSVLVKVLVGIIILPFVFWGMGDVFRGGNQNIIASIDSRKISTKDFVDYVYRLNISEKDRNNITKSNLIDQMLSEYIGREIISLEVEALGIGLSEKSLRNILTNDKYFYKNDKFSRTKYEEFLLKSGITAPAFEKNLVEQEKKRQLLSYLSSGTKIPSFLVKESFRKENQKKTIKYVDLKNYYQKKIIKQEEIKKIYDENKDIFAQQFKTISLIELKPEELTGQNEYDEKYFKEVDKIENSLLDGLNIKEISESKNLKITKTKEVNIKKLGTDGKKIEFANDELFNIIYSQKNTNKPELINIKSKYYIGEVSSAKKIDRGLSDKKVYDSIKAQIEIKNKITENTNIVKDISNGLFNKARMNEFAKKNSLQIKSETINGLKDNNIFSESIIKEIFKSEDGEISLITDSKLSVNYIVLSEKTEFVKLNKKSDDYKKYQSIAKLNLAQNFYKSYDKKVNEKYEIDLNNKAIKRVKNS
ncbi:SurA N-terminal domain-containing protein, partial [Pelagibacteraceae bacterium]|nr:SurA N-terminal domain-containing protein [Pelagibacteraceae bacterium]